MDKSIKDVVCEKYGSINNFIIVKTKEYNGELPISREAIYKIIAHNVDNPGIKTLNILADMIGMPREEIYKEFEGD